MYGNDASLNVHSILCARGLEKARCSLMPESARTEVDTNPNPILLVREDVHVVVVGSYSAQLIFGHPLQSSDLAARQPA